MDSQGEATGTSCGTFSQHSPAATRSGWCLANPEPRKSWKRTITPGRGGGGTTQEQPPSAQSMQRHKQSIEVFTALLILSSREQAASSQSPPRNSEKLPYFLLPLFPGPHLCQPAVQSLSGPAHVSPVALPAGLLPAPCRLWPWESASGCFFFFSVTLEIGDQGNISFSFCLTTASYHCSHSAAQAEDKAFPPQWINRDQACRAARVAISSSACSDLGCASSQAPCSPV